MMKIEGSGSASDILPFAKEKVQLQALHESASKNVRQIWPQKHRKSTKNYKILLCGAGLLKDSMKPGCHCSGSGSVGVGAVSC
jgi:hypothetical protein